MKNALSFIARILGFEKLSKYENEYLHDANIRSSSYMGLIVFCLETWMRFLSSFENSEKFRTLLDCIVNMASRIIMLTLTEGVETESQAAFLNKIGCGRLQGYLYGKPIPKQVLYSRIDKGELVVSDKQL